MARSNDKHVRSWRRVRSNDKRIVALQPGDITGKHAIEKIDVAVLNRRQGPQRVGDHPLFDLRRLRAAAKTIVAVDAIARAGGVARQYRIRLLLRRFTFKRGEWENRQQRLGQYMRRA